MQLRRWTEREKAKAEERTEAARAAVGRFLDARDVEAQHRLASAATDYHYNVAVQDLAALKGLRDFLASWEDR